MLPHNDDANQIDGDTLGISHYDIKNFSLDEAIVHSITNQQFYISYILLNNQLKGWGCEETNHFMLFKNGMFVKWYNGTRSNHQLAKSLDNRPSLLHFLIRTLFFV